RDSVKNGILISIRRTGDGFHPGLFNILDLLQKERRFKMKKVVALLLTLSMLISANTFVFADSAETGNSTESYQQRDNSENQIVTYLSVADPSVKKGDAVRIIVGLADGIDQSNARLTVENTDLNQSFEISGEMTEDGNLIFESSDLVSGCYTVKSLETDGYSVDFEAIGINSQFGIDTVVMDLNADAYAEDSDNSNSDNENTGSEVYDAVVINPDETSTQAAGNTISEAIAAAADVQQNNLFRASSAVNVVLDPGHGGNDGGAQASYGGKTYLEKTLNLKIAQYCKEELSKYKRVNVYMTRNDDHYVALEDRVNYAKSVGASVFVSIHNNSTTSSSVHGATVYYPNSSLNANIGAQGGALANEVLKQLVALGLANDGTRIRNSESGDTYTDGSICDYYSVIRNSKKAGFPGIIIEHAYISNQSDATNYLGSETALKKLGIADAQGIVNYFGLKQEDYHLIFDASYYLNNNPDVKNNWGNTAEAALQHFIKYGMAEGRRGNEIFDVHFYKDNNIDLQNAFGDNWYLYYQHYLENGIREGRQASENFDVISYKTRYRDLQSAFGDDYEGYVDHYISYGINEERDASPLRYKVDFVDNGQIVESQNVLCMRGAKAPEITKTGYVLSWDKAYNKIASDTTVNAVWAPVTVKLNFDAAGGNITNTSKNITYGGTYGDLESPERDGYTFTGWYTAANGGTQITKDTKVEVTSDQTIYAHWTANSYAVTFNADGGTVTANTKTVTFGNAYGELPTPTRSGYTFAGWWTAVDSGEQISFNSAVKTASDHVLYAHWVLNSVSVSYQTHVANIGWQNGVSNGAMAGTVGRGLQLEAIKINVKSDADIGVIYTTHVKNDGWHGNSFNGEQSGTTGQNKHVEALMLKLTGKDADKYDIYYRVHAQNYGWLAWAKNGEAAGTSGYAYRLEAIQIVVTAKGDMAPTVFYGGYTSNNAKAYISKTSTVPIINTNASVRYQSHVSNIGWQSAVENGSLSGTTGRNLGLEAIKIDLDGQPCSGGIKYQTHVQNIGWQNTVMDGALAGTTGRALNVEAINMSLTGEMANQYDIYYRVHAQNYGWLGWAKNGQNAGTSGQNLHLEALQIVLVKKGQSAPGNNYGGIISKNTMAYIAR
ncbi:N-acetylmuramoyl-L-alanine amidase, partial [Agathobacter rectalis]|uniref:N-acetylmuramoyl-L-alanine amidase n=2 Tax=Agathobacter rectalis TaxID=39491 RepID=UPI00321C0900